MNKKSSRSNYEYNIYYLILLGLIGAASIISMGYSIANFYRSDVSAGGLSPLSMDVAENIKYTKADDASEEEVNSLKELVRILRGQSLDTQSLINDITNTLDQFVVFGQSTCNDQEGIYNESRFFPFIVGEYDAIIRNDNVRAPRDLNDPTRTNITYFPAVPQPRPDGSGLGINSPFLVGNLINHTTFKKFQSVPDSIGFFLNVSFLDILSTDERLTVFLKNVEDRGLNNLEHARYMAALDKSKVVGRYGNRIKTFVASLYNSWVISKLPILSTFKTRLIDFFLDIHLGTADHPAFMKAYFSDFLIFISVTDSNADAAKRNMKGHMNSKCVREYVQKRIALIISQSLTDTITWNWIQAGMPIESVTIEAMHNIVAFSQFDNTIHLLITQSMNPSVLTPGTGGNSFLNLFRFAAPTETAKINVVREYMRIMLPNNLWFSRNVENNCVGCSTRTQTRHIPQLIQIRAEYDAANLTTPWFPAGLSSSTGWNTARARYATYDPSRYTAFPARFSDAVYSGNNTTPSFDYNDTAAGLLCKINAFKTSVVDNETLIPSGDDSMIPVFKNPIYAAFGLGARRCPGEIFSQFVIFELFKAVQCLQFYDDCTLNPSRCIPTSSDYKYGPIPLAPFKAAPDSLFVKGVPSCAYPESCSAA